MKQQVFSRDFTLVVIGQIISLFGNAILHFALPLYLLRETRFLRAVWGGHRLFLPAHGDSVSRRRSSGRPGQ